MDRAYLENIRRNLVAQRDQGFAVYQQAVGALALIDELLTKPADGGSAPVVAEMTLDELGKAIEAGAQMNGHAVD